MHEAGICVRRSVLERTGNQITGFAQIAYINEKNLLTINPIKTILDQRHRID